MLVKVFSDFCSSEEAMGRYAMLWNDGNLFFTDDGKEFEFTVNDDYTHAILMNKAMPQLKEGIPKQNVLGVAQEPLEFLHLTPEFVEYCIKNVGTYLIGKTAIAIKNDENQIGLFQLPPPFTCAFTYQWFNKNCNYSTIVEKKWVKNTPIPVAIWFSQKVATPMHEYRVKLVQEILKTTPKELPIDIYGRGCEAFLKDVVDPRIKGEYSNDEPYKNYKYCVSIENTDSDYYITEKLMNCYVYNTIPVYLGAKKVEEIFGEKSVIRLTGTLEDDMSLLKELCSNTSQKLVDLDEARVQLFEGKGNFLKFIIKHFT